MVDSLNFYKERKVTFTKENSFLELELYNEDEKKGEIILLPKKGDFSCGLINISLLDSLKLFKMDLKNHSKEAQELIEGFMQGNCLNMEYKAIMTHEVDYALQHELQHIFDNLLDVEGDKVDREYRAYLAGLKYSEDNVLHLLKIPQYIEMKMEEEGEKIFKGKYKNNYLALIRIMQDFSDVFENNGEITTEEVKERSKILLDENYVKNMSMGYDKLLLIMNNIYSVMD